MRRTILMAAAAALLVLSGCGTTRADRTISGGLIGAGAGAAIGASVGNPAAGAAIGGVAGAAAGALSDPCDISFGDPLWKSHYESRQDYRRRCGRDPR